MVSELNLSLSFGVFCGEVFLKVLFLLFQSGLLFFDLLLGFSIQFSSLSGTRVLTFARNLVTAITTITDTVSDARRGDVVWEITFVQAIESAIWASSRSCTRSQKDEVVTHQAHPFHQDSRSNRHLLLPSRRYLDTQFHQIGRREYLDCEANTLLCTFRSNT